jgi:parallel beta-helix repeat protein
MPVEERGIGTAVIIVIVVVIVVVVAGGAYLSLKGGRNGGGGGENVINPVVLTPHDPILIESNAGFTATNGVIGGSGTASDPYIIKNWIISRGNLSGEAIYVGHTSAYFIISNCVVKNAINGIHLDEVSNGILVNNTCENNDDGIALTLSFNNILENNTCAYNSWGIFISGWSSNNLIYHNNLENNGTQAYDDNANYWDNGYPSGGNYWSHWSYYQGPDNYHGPNQNIPGSDGISDTPEFIAGGSNQDHYPLMNPI